MESENQSDIEASLKQLLIGKSVPIIKNDAVHEQTGLFSSGV